MYRCPIREATAQFRNGRTFGDLPDLPQHVVGQRHSGMSGPGLQLAVELVGNVTDLNHRRHVANLHACDAHVNWFAVFGDSRLHAATGQ